MAARPSCHNCVYACWDLCQVMQSFSSGFPHRPRCANQPGTPAVMRPTPVGAVCSNYHARPAKPEGNNVKAIPLADGFYAYVDAADYEWLSRYTWRLYAGGYAGRHDRGKTIYMHREIMEAPKGTMVDHIDGSKANNCRFNLRMCTRQENQRNRGKARAPLPGSKGFGSIRDATHGVRDSRSRASVSTWAISQMKSRRHVHTTARRSSTTASSPG